MNMHDLDDNVFEYDWKRCDNYKAKSDSEKGSTDEGSDVTVLEQSGDGGMEFKMGCNVARLAVERQTSQRHWSDTDVLFMDQHGDKKVDSRLCSSNQDCSAALSRNVCEKIAELAMHKSEQSSRAEGKEHRNSRKKLKHRPSIVVRLANGHHEYYYYCKSSQRDSLIESLALSPQIRRPRTLSLPAHSRPPSQLITSEKKQGREAKAKPTRHKSLCSSSYTPKVTDIPPYNPPTQVTSSHVSTVPENSPQTTATRPLLRRDSASSNTTGVTTNTGLPVRSYSVTSRGILCNGERVHSTHTGQLTRRGSLLSDSFFTPKPSSLTAVVAADRHVSSSTSSYGSNYQSMPSSSGGIPKQYRVWVYGAQNVGKTRLIDEFLRRAAQSEDGQDSQEMTEEYDPQNLDYAFYPEEKVSNNTTNYESYSDDDFGYEAGRDDDVFMDGDVVDDSSARSVSVLVDSEEIILSFTEINNYQNHSPSRDAVDAFMIVYSVTDMDSWEAVVDILQSITQRETIRPATILVANKMDLVRGRVVSTNDGKMVATNFQCKYVEVSSLLRMNVDDLLVGISHQVKLNTERAEAKNKARTVSPGTQLRKKFALSSRSGSVDKQPLFARFFSRTCSLLSSKSCEDLLAL